MGGVPLLLMAIAMGITYGWHPDGAGGVNYIIQVPPEQLDAVRRSGEISSVIDPEVRGHVSRIIIRVGEGPLPRDTPADFALIVVCPAMWCRPARTTIRRSNRPS